MKRIFVCLMAMLSMSCTKEPVSSIPNYSVNITIDLSREWRLKELYSSKIFDSNYAFYQANPQVGFGGILLYHGPNNNGSGDRYYAFDAACPYEAQKNVTVEVEEGGMNAKCPKCGSVFDLSNGLGNPKTGSLATEYLRQYPVTVGTDKIIVRNY